MTGTCTILNMAKRGKQAGAQKVWSRIYLREIREARGLSQEQLEEQSGVSTGMISLIENRLSSGSPDSLERLAEALDIELGDLFIEPVNGKTLLRMWVDDDEKSRVRAVIAALTKKS